MIDISIIRSERDIIMTTNAHFMNGRDAYAIAFQTHSEIEKHEIDSRQIDEIRHYYSLLMQFTMHHDFIDSCAFDSMVEIDNVLELRKDHTILSWQLDDFIMHYQFDVRAMHHFASLELHGMHAMHNRDACTICNDDFENACCLDIGNMRINPVIAFTMSDLY